MPAVQSFHRRNSGVTLIELAITIALVGILAAMIVQFLNPVRSYIDSSRRAALADTADTALRRVGRDLHLALPNSVRVDGTGRYVEFLLVRVGGRYRYDIAASSTSGCPAGGGSSPTEDVLVFGAPDNCFKTIGNLYTTPADISQITTNDYVVIFNLQPETDKADAYQSLCGASCNKAQITGKAALSGEDRIEFGGGNTFTYESPGNRFFIIEGPVTYGCDLGAGTLTRYWGYTIPASQNAPPTGATSALMASGVTACSFTYDTTSQGAGLVTMALRLAMQDSHGDTENVNLYHTVHVNNVP